MRLKPRSPKPQEADEWVVVAEYQLDPDADMAVGLLEGNGVPAMRFPVAGLTVSAWGLIQPVRVLVPAERLEEARELLEE